LDAAVVEEASEPDPVVHAVTDLLGDRGLGGDARKLLLKPGPERRNWQLAPRSGSDGRRFDVINPADEAKLASVAGTAPFPVDIEFCPEHRVSSFQRR
jgi:hypothetical protein